MNKLNNDFWIRKFEFKNFILKYFPINTKKLYYLNTKQHRPILDLEVCYKNSKIK